MEKGKQRKHRSRASSERSSSTRAGNPPSSARSGEQPQSGTDSAGGSWLVLLLIATVVAYLPTLGADFVRWDDQFYVTENELIRDADGWKAFWDPTDRRAPQFYPLVFSSYWLEYRLWGLDPRGYHAVNLALHLGSTAMAFVLARWWGFSAASSFLVGAVFALHPVQVASVAWVSERKNVLCGFFLLAAFAAFWKARKANSNGWLAASFLCFAASLLSKTQALLLPLSFALFDWADRRTRGEDVPRTFWKETALALVPFLALSALLAWMTIRFEHDRWPPLAYYWLERFFIATNALVFYVLSVIWPAGLSPIYPKWNIDPAALRWWIAPGLVGVGCFALWFWRRVVPPRVLAGLAHFLLGLVPVLGIVPFNFFTYSFVADHFLYFSMLGVGAVVAAVGARLGERKLVPIPAAAAALALILGGLSFHEAMHWRDNLSFWLHVRQGDPDGFLPNFNLGLHFRREQNWPEATRYFRTAAEARPAADFVFRRYAEALRYAHGPQAVAEMCTEWLKTAPRFAPAYLERGLAREQLGQGAEAAEDYELAVRFAPGGSAIASEARARLAALRAQPTGHDP